jgi:hypothetical protein
MLVGILFEISEIKEDNSSHDQSFIFFSGLGREKDREVISIRKSSLQATSASLLKSGDVFSRRALDIEVDGLAWITWELAVHTELAATTVKLVFKIILSIINIDNEVAEIKGILNLTDVFILSIFAQSYCNFRAIETVAGTLAWSIDLQEGFIIELFEFIINSIDSDLEGSAFTTQALSGEAS